jgi:demethylmenaquinone methyltransferase/2-methoxy-6-polyprenyl-1,4-benzoquinol methylase
LATDIGEQVLELARAKHYAEGKVRFTKMDGFIMEGIPRAFTAAFAGFWWSHIPASRIRPFLSTLHARLEPDALVVLVDNNYVEGSSTRISRLDADGNTYQRRTLADGTTYEVMKNFPSEARLRDAVRRYAWDIDYTALRYYWCLTYRVRSA